MRFDCIDDQLPEGSAMSVSRQIDGNAPQLGQVLMIVAPFHMIARCGIELNDVGGTRLAFIVDTKGSREGALGSACLLSFGARSWARPASACRRPVHAASVML